MRSVRYRYRDMCDRVSRALSVVSVYVPVDTLHLVLPLQAIVYFYLFYCRRCANVYVNNRFIRLMYLQAELIQLENRDKKSKPNGESTAINVNIDNIYSIVFCNQISHSTLILEFD